VSRITRAALRVDRALIELAAIGRISEPDAAVRMRNDVVGRVEVLAVEVVSNDRDRAVELVTDDSPREMLAADLPALEVERIAVAVVRGHAEHAHVTVVLQPSHLPVVGNVAPDEITALRIPGRPLRPQRTGPQSLDRRVGLAEAIEARIDGQDVGVGEIDVWRRMGPEIAGRAGYSGRRRGGSGLRYSVPSPEGYGPRARRHTRDKRPPRNSAARILNAIILISHVFLPRQNERLF
jgi:hypothetical protein